MRRQSETWLLVPLLPILSLGAIPMLMLVFLGFAGLGILGVLMIGAGLADGLDANRDFNRQVIVHGYARQSERTVQASKLHLAVRSATVVTVAGIGLVVVALVGLFG
ncbi:hypothetical protein [Bradyrhizobium sp.]|uniref:hypothetical protein n=1 Tax=Bradyrhizobium sp. TaxID=376 RepID=UPI003C712808